MPPRSVAVVGAGPAGVAAALTAHQQGLRTACLDRAAFPRDKTCGDGLTAGALHLLEGLGVPVPVIESTQPVTTVVLRDPYHQPHLQNFFDAVRGKAKLNCPPEVGYESAVSVLKVNEAIEAKTRVAFKPEDFKI